jgi:ABC-type transporter Mla subunit MlaD
LTSKIAQAKDARSGVAQLKDAIQAHHDEFQKTITKGENIANPYADRLQQAKDNLSAFDTTIKALSKQIAPLEDGRRKASAVLAKAMDSHAEDLVAKSQAKLEDIAGQQSVLKNRLSAALENLAGIASDPRGIEVDYNKVAALVSGRYGEPFVQHLINSKNPIDIWRDLKKSIPIEAAVALSKAQTREDVLGVLAPLIGGKIESALPLTTAAKITANADGVVHQMLPNWVKDTVIKSGDKIQSQLVIIDPIRSYQNTIRLS